MDKEYLDKTQYSWFHDPRHLRVDGKIPSGRCFHCGRTFLNARAIDSFCKDCDKAMSTNKYGPDFDYTHLLGGKEAYNRRELREPLDFDFEAKLEQIEKEKNFKLANGKPIPIEPDEDDSDLYRMGLER